MSTAETPRYWAIVPAAGVGRRMNVDIPKQYLEIRGKTLMEHTVERLLNFPILGKIVVVLDKDDETCRHIELLNNDRILFAEGGEERYNSVLNGLAVLNQVAADHDWVMVHDVARPCVRKSDLEWLVESLRTHPVGGILGNPVRDTMKRTDSLGEITDTVDREQLWHALTPQMFRMKLLRNAMIRVVDENVSVTDEAGAIEYAGYKPLMVEGHPDNIKVTRGSDLALASLYIEQQSKLIEIS